MKRIVILTGSELRHIFLGKAVALNPEIRVLRTFCEGRERDLSSVIESQADSTQQQLMHVAARSLSEADFFGTFVKLTPDLSNAEHIPKGNVNSTQVQKEIVQLNPDLIIAYGCSIVKEPLLSDFAGRFLNVHLGLSPYYRGSGTNFWALVNNEPEFCGATFMHINAGVDTGQVIHQIRARIFPGDSPHQIGNRLISDVAETYVELIRKFDFLCVENQIQCAESKYYRQKDFSPEAVSTLYKNFDDGLVDAFLINHESRTQSVPVVTNSALRK